MFVAGLLVGFGVCSMFAAWYLGLDMFVAGLLVGFGVCSMFAAWYLLKDFFTY
jgi:hypothetical protein